MRRRKTHVLQSMLSYCRPAGSDAESDFTARFIAPLPGSFRDAGGNYHVNIADGPILWSCHTDTVHRQPGRQAVVFDRELGAMYLPFHSPSRCLGADDTVGVFLCREMILAGTPGYYVFHYGEEIGGIGSSYLAATYADWLRTRTYAIALDRAGTSDVITHQYAGRTASDVFARSIARELRRIDPALQYRPSKTGIYTDTAEYAGLISECSNLSVGYSRQHSPAESVDIRHVMRLRRALIKLRPAALQSDRIPHDPIYVRSYRGIDWTDDLDLASDSGRPAECDTIDPRETSTFLSDEYAALQRYEQELARYEIDRIWSDESGYSWDRGTK